MGSSTARGKHAGPRTGVLPSFALPVARARHGRPSHGPAGAAVLAVVAGGVLTVALPATGSTGPAYAASSATTAVAPSPATAAVPSPATLALSQAAVDARQALADRASRSRPAPVAVVASPFRSPAVSTPTPAPKPLLPGCTREVSTDGANGRLPSRVLCDVGSGERLRADAARAYAALAVAYASRFGTELCLIDGYRTLGEQQQLRQTKRRFAAAPGTSEHGWGLAVDLGCAVKSRRTVEHQWMQANGPRFGWVNPEWAQAGGSKPEPWHWEFQARA